MFHHHLVTDAVALTVLFAGAVLVVVDSIDHRLRAPAFDLWRTIMPVKSLGGAGSAWLHSCDRNSPT